MHYLMEIFPIKKQKPLFKGSAEEYILEITRIRTIKNAYTEIYIKGTDARSVMIQTSIAT